MKSPMSISLNVVRRALVFWDSFRRRAIVWRILLILTRVSTRAPVISVGAFFAVCEVVEPPWGCCGAALLGGAGAALGSGAAAGFGCSGAGVEAAGYSAGASCFGAAPPSGALASVSISRN